MWVKLANEFKNFEKVEQRGELHGLIAQALFIRKARCKEVFVRVFVYSIVPTDRLDIVKLDLTC